MTEWILTSSVLIVVVLVLRRLLRSRISLRLRYALWTLVLVRLLVPFSLPQSKISVAELASPQLENIETIIDTPIRSPEYEAARRQVLDNFLHQQIDPASVPAEALEEQVISVMVDRAYQQLQQEYTQSAGAAQIPDSQLRQEAQNLTAQKTYQIELSSILAAIWLGGAVLMGLVFLCSNTRLMLHLRRSRVRQPIAHTLPFYTTGYVATPCLCGLTRPGIYLPFDMAFSDSLPHILAHETTHYRHGDHIWSALRCICLALHWYNPLVWLAAYLSKKDAELACDEATIARLGESQRTAYGKTLITMTCAKRDPRDLFLTATTMNTGKRTLKERVTMIAKHPKTALYTLIAVILVMSITVGCTFTGAGGTKSAVTSNPAVDTNPSDTTEPAPSGYPDGEIDARLVYVNGTLYMDAGNSLLEKIPASCSQAGTIVSCDDFSVPREELHGAHVSKDSIVYVCPSNPSYICVEAPSSGLIWMFVRTNQFQDQLTPPPPEQPSTDPLLDILQPAGTPMDEEGVAQIQTLFEDYHSWYTMATTSTYSMPSQVDLSLMFYNGFPDDPEVILTKSEKEYLHNTWLGFWIGHLEFTILHAEDMNDVLRTYFGISLDDTAKRGANNFVYWDKTDCYYLAHNDCLGQSVEVHSVYIRPGGMIDVYYTPESYYILENTPQFYVMTLQLTGDSLFIRSNWEADPNFELPEASAFAGIYFPYEHSGDSGTALSEEELAYFNAIFDPVDFDFRGYLQNNLLCSFFTSYYDSPAALDLKEFLYCNPLSTAVSGDESDKIFELEGWTDSAPVPIHKYSREDINEALYTYMGIHLKDLDNRSAREGLHYLNEYGAYYNTSSDAGSGTFTAQRGEWTDGEIRLYDGNVCLTLRQFENRWVIVSHQIVSK